MSWWQQTTQKFFVFYVDIKKQLARRPPTKIAATTVTNITHDKPDTFQEAMNWETSRIEMIENSERRAWKVAFSASGLAILAMVAIFIMLPLKQTVPYVVRVDNATGVPDIMTMLKDERVSHDDVMDKYWLSQYVLARETYDWYTLQKDYQTVGLLSSPTVGAEYAEKFTGVDALDKKNGASMRSTIQIVSVVPDGNGTGTVRFIKTTKRIGDTGAGIVSRWIATIAYEYRNPSKMKESARLINPFGFQVQSYRVDPEMGGK